MAHEAYPVGRTHFYADFFTGFPTFAITGAAAGACLTDFTFVAGTITHFFRQTAFVPLRAPVRHLISFRTSPFSIVLRFAMLLLSRARPVGRRGADTHHAKCGRANAPTGRVASTSFRPVFSWSRGGGKGP